MSEPGPSPDSLNNDRRLHQQRFYWKGKRVKEDLYKKRVQQTKIARSLNGVKSGRFMSYNPQKKSGNTEEKSRKVSMEKIGDLNSYNDRKQISDTEKVSNKDIESNFEVEGRRIVHIKTLGEKLFCMKCSTTVLSLSDVVEEKRCGLASTFYIQCRICKAITGVDTDKKHMSRNKVLHFNSNTKIAFGILNGGLGNTHVNKVLAAVDIPELYTHTYKSHEMEVGKAIEEVAKESCLAAALEERRLTIEHADELKDLLPSDLDIHFIFPDSNPSDIINRNIPHESRVRIAASYDMGWPTRGTGRSYDSLSGTGHMIGLFTGKVIGYVTLNRKCAKCDLGHPKDDHDCRLNFIGSAKAMEPQAAVLLTKNNEILKSCNLQIGIIIADNDSSSICAIREACQHEVAKQSDKNHTTKGVSSELFKISKNHKELNSTTIEYLKKCFSYSVAQNRGNCEAMAEAIRNIPYHCFNLHENCGNWCRYKTDPKNYTHTNIGTGFQDQNLFTALKNIFENLSLKSSQFVANASSNTNESLNGIIVSKAPKRTLYGKSSSGDIRVACAVNKKNIGEKYSSDVLQKKLSLSPGKHTARYNQKIDCFHEKRYKKSTTTTQKAHRLFLKKAKTQLKNKNESREGTTYESNVGLLNNLLESIPVPTADKTEKLAYIYFDLETGGFSKNADILQIAAKHETYEFSVYIQPKRKIAEEASKVHGLRVTDGKLYLHEKPIETVSILEAIVGLLEFLCLFKKKCILIAHNCNFDYPRLMETIGKYFMKEHFKAIVYGFCDTLPLIKKITGKKGKGENKLVNLAENLKISSEGAHNALEDVHMLQKIILHLDISEELLLENTFSWSVAAGRLTFQKNLPAAMKNLDALKDCTSYGMRKKIIAASITYDTIIDAYRCDKDLGISNLLGKNENGKIKVTKDKRVLKRIVEFLEKNQSCL